MLEIVVAKYVGPDFWNHKLRKVFLLKDTFVTQSWRLDSVKVDY